MLALPLPRHDNVAAADHAQPARNLHALDIARDIDDPGTCGIDERLCRYLGHSPAFHASKCYPPALIDALRRQESMARQDQGAMPLRPQEIGDHQTGIIAPAIGIGEAVMILRLQRRTRRMLAKIDRFRSLQNLALGDHRRKARA